MGCSPVVKLHVYQYTARTAWAETRCLTWWYLVVQPVFILVKPWQRWHRPEMLLNRTLMPRCRALIAGKIQKKAKAKTLSKSKKTCRNVCSLTSLYSAKVTRWLKALNNFAKFVV